MFATASQVDLEKALRHRYLDQDSAEWLDARALYELTASEMGAALGVETAYQSRQALWGAKCLDQKQKQSPMTEEMLRHGKVNEKKALALLCSKLYINPANVYSTGLWPYMDKNSPFYLKLAASPDARLFNPFTRQWEIAEIKCPAQRMASAPNLNYWLQMQCQMWCTDTKVCWFASVRYPSTKDEEVSMSEDKHWQRDSPLNWCIYRVDRCSEYVWTTNILFRAAQFLEFVKDNEAPPRRTEKMKADDALLEEEMSRTTHHMMAI